MDPAMFEPKLRRARRRLALRRFLLGRTHRATGDAYYQTGTLFRLAGDMDAAARYLTMAERIHRKRLGPGHPALALDLISIGENQAHWGERRRALQSFEKAERILEANLRKDPAARCPLERATPLAQHLGRLRSSMGEVHRDLEQPGKARTCLERALALLLHEPGPDSPDAVRAAALLVHLGVDPRAVARELGGEPSASALSAAYRQAHGMDPNPEPMS